MTTDTDAERPASMGDGFADAMGFEVKKLTGDEVIVELEVGPRHLQPFGIVHGGVHCGIVETICSVGAAAHVAPNGQIVVGVENHTSFLRPVRSGRLRGVAKPIHRGRRAHLWEATITDEADRVVCTGRVRLFCMEAGSEVAGKPAKP